MIVLDLIYNLSLLMALSVASAFVDSHLRRPASAYINGVLFGLIAIVGMQYPFVWTEGVIFDGRSIIISLCSLLFGPLAGLISAIIAAVWRYTIAGPGLATGLLVIFASFAIGWFFHHYARRKSVEMVSLSVLYLMGFLVHVVVLLLMYNLPTERVDNPLPTIAVTLILTYPIITVLIGKIFLDNEHKRRTLDELRHQEERLRLIVGSTNDVIFTIDTKHRYTAMYGTWIQEYGLKATDFVGKTHREIQVDGNADLHDSMGTKAFQGENVTYEWSINGRFGIEYYQTKLAPIRDGSDKILGLVGVSRNVTDLKMAESVLKDQLKKLSDITWIQSHEVRAPVARIMSLAELLRTTTHEEEAAKISEYLMESAMELDTVIRNIVETAKYQR